MLDIVEPIQAPPSQAQQPQQPQQRQRQRRSHKTFILDLEKIKAERQKRKEQRQQRRESPRKGTEVESLKVKEEVQRWATEFVMAQPEPERVGASNVRHVVRILPQVFSDRAASTGISAEEEWASSYLTQRDNVLSLQNPFGT